MAAAPQKELTSIWTPANIVTCVRIIFIPVFMVFATEGFASLGLSAGAQAIIAFCLYILLSGTDKVDGDLARKRGEVTDFGKFLDPIADKLLVFSALLLFLVWDIVSVWAVFIILFREFLVSALRMVASVSGEVIAADKLGKAKTAVTMVAICALLLDRAILVQTGQSVEIIWTIGQALMIAAVVLTVVSGAQYFWNARKIVFRV